MFSEMRNSGADSVLQNRSIHSFTIIIHGFLTLPTFLSKNRLLFPQVRKIWQKSKPKRVCLIFFFFSLFKLEACSVFSAFHKILLFRDHASDGERERERERERDRQPWHWLGPSPMRERMCNLLIPCAQEPNLHMKEGQGQKKWLVPFFSPFF